ncbi:cell division protein PerM [Enemella sp. A6]|uniref:cell division protein PerM n=1 Tax=Enemella sp. A6 TaxID=3440152 RepID=UPI003EBDE193
MSTGSSRRRGPQITLAVTTADHDDSPDEPISDRVMPPTLAGFFGGLVAAAGGWILVAGLVVAAWLTARVGSLTDALQIATGAWVAGHGGGFEAGPMKWTVIPLGLTLLFSVMVHAVATFAARQELAGSNDPTERDRARAARRATGWVVLGYVIGPAVAAVWVGGGEQAARAFLGAAVLAAIFGWLGAARGARYRWLSRLPRPWPAVVHGTMASVATLLLLSLAILVAAVIMHWQRVDELAQSLEANTAGTVLLWVLQALFLPNAVLWTGSWMLGAGFTFGVESVVSPAVTDLGLLPAIPVLGALPSEGVNSVHPLWWLLGGALGGVVAATWTVRQRPRARFDETALIGGLAGLLAALVFVALAAVSGGDLGTEHLVGVGPRLLELLIMSLGVLGISGVVTGLVIGLLRLRRLRTVVGVESDSEETRE